MTALMVLLAQTCAGPASARDVVVVVVDTGVEKDVSPLFVGRVLPGYDAVTNTVDAVPPDESGHGTHLVSQVLSLAPCAKVVPVRWTRGRGEYKREQWLAALHYVAWFVTPRHVVNLSSSGDAPIPGEQEALERTAGLVVTVAGNEGADLRRRPVYPACLKLKNMVVVGSGHRDGRRAASSGHGPLVDAYAWGVDVPGTGLGGKTVQESGTSVAAARFSGLVARELCLHPEVETARQAADRVIARGRKIAGGLFVDPR